MCRKGLIVRCAVCQSEEVECAYWANPNTGKVSDLFSDVSVEGSTFCPDCDGHVPLEIRESDA